MKATKIIKPSALIPMQYPIADNIVYNLPIIKTMASLIIKNFDAKHNFINLICRGCSGAMISAVIASIVPQVRNVYYLRKDHEISHDKDDYITFASPLDSEINIFVDDYIDTGATLLKVREVFTHKLHGIVVSGGITMQANEKTSSIQVDTIICSAFIKSD